MTAASTYRTDLSSVFAIPLVDSSNLATAAEMYSYGALYRTGVGSTLAAILVIVGLYYLVTFFCTRSTFNKVEFCR